MRSANCYEKNLSSLMAVSERLFSAGVGRTDKAIVYGANNSLDQKEKGKKLQRYTTFLQIRTVRIKKKFNNHVVINDTTRDGAMNLITENVVDGILT